MEKRAKVIFGPQALEDLKHIYDFVSLDDPARACQLVERLIERISRLSNFPHLGVVPKDSHLHDKGYRVLVVENYLVFYFVKRRLVRIRRVLHGARDYAHLL